MIHAATLNTHRVLLGAIRQIIMNNSNATLIFPQYSYYYARYGKYAKKWRHVSRTMTSFKDDPALPHRRQISSVECAVFQHCRWCRSPWKYCPNSGKGGLWPGKYLRDTWPEFPVEFLWHALMSE